MKPLIKLFTLIIFVYFFSSDLTAEIRGKVLTSLKFESRILNTNINYSVYLPASYFTDTMKTYPVFYLLHGYTDDETAWIEKGWVDHAADQGIFSGTVDEMIIIMPDGGLKWYVNQPDGNFNYEDMFITEFIPFIDKAYRTKADRKYRAIGGLSMGGYGALGYSMRHPEMFSACAAYSAAIRPDDEILSCSQKDFDFLYKPVYGKGVKGEDRLSQHWVQNNPLHLAKTLSKEVLNSVEWYISCGDDDHLFYGNSVLHKIFRDREIKHEYRVRNGGHNWNYWRKYIKNGLEFITGAFRKNINKGK